jgi:hypothetical protein
MTSAEALRERAKGVAAELPDVEMDAGGWSAAGNRFAILEGDAIELHLDEPVARAATRTPDTSPSHRGLDWVRFAPGELDDHAVDRLDAWFRFAYRRARS